MKNEFIIFLILIVILSCSSNRNSELLIKATRIQGLKTEILNLYKDGNYDILIGKTIIEKGESFVTDSIIHLTKEHAPLITKLSTRKLIRDADKLCFSYMEIGSLDNDSLLEIPIEKINSIDCYTIVMQ
jgi:hypothetical protein|tara:strand:+ start:1026 stop:1412 length:387 start_codon:yes stop_codon:yes gene_type:complete